MDMGRPVGMAARGLQKPSHGPIPRYRVKARDDGAEPEAAVLVGCKQAAQVAFGLLVQLLDVVEAVCIGLPDVDPGIRYRDTLVIGDGAGDQAGLSVVDAGDVVTECALRRDDYVEWAFNCRLSGYAVGFVVQRVDEHRHAQNVGQEDELLTGGCAGLAGVGKELDRTRPFLLAEADFLDEGMQVVDKRCQYLPKPGIGG